MKRFESPDGRSTGAILMRAGKAAQEPSSTGGRKVDRLLASWLHCPLPMASLAFVTLTVLMGPATDAPHLLFEFIFSGPPVDQSAVATLQHSGSAAAAHAAHAASAAHTAGAAHAANAAHAASAAGATSASAEDAGGGTAASPVPAVSSAFNQLTVVMDVIARKDLVADAEYRQRVYETSQLARLWAQCAADKRLEPFSPATLFLRAALSPTALLFSLKPTPTTTSDSSSSVVVTDASPGKPRASSEKPAHSGAVPQQQSAGPHESADWLTETVEETVCPLAKDVLSSWLEAAGSAKAVGGEDEQHVLLARDKAIVQCGIQVDLTSNLPRLFGQKITDEIVDVFRNL
ncbi:unnamed protein product [Closterium sp. NIES-65]|nr:unnamed protein product [Closterium sp. NIES-65]